MYTLLSVLGGGGGGERDNSLFTRVIDKLVVFFLHPALAQTRDYSRSNYTYMHLVIYDTPVPTWNK